MANAVGSLETAAARQSMGQRAVEALRGHPVVAFFIISYALMYASYFTYIANQEFPLAPFWFIGVFSPTIAALFLSAILGGRAEVRRLLAGFTRWRIGRIWYVVALSTVLIPLVLGIGYVALGNEFVGPAAGITGPFLLGELFFIFLSGPLSEEAGWRGFALPRLQERHSALTAAIVIGVVWTFWHVPVYFMPGHTIIPLPMFLPVTIGLSILFTWVYNNTGGSLLATVLMHFSFNFSGAFLAGHLGLMPPMLLYIGGGSAIGLLTVVVVVVFGWRRLSRA